MTLALLTTLPYILSLPSFLGNPRALQYFDLSIFEDDKVLEKRSTSANARFSKSYLSSSSSRIINP